MSGHLPRWIFLKLLGITLIVACVSFWTQAHGLVGEGGIVPASEGLARLGVWLDEQGRSRWLAAPTLGWWGAGDAALTLLCLLGTVAGASLVAGIAPRLALGLGWVAYLSLFHLGEPFLGYQWDILLIETLLVAIPYAPGGLRPQPGLAPPPHPVALWAVRLLLFKLIFSSGVVKLTSGDATWADGTALDYHYWTQPLPHLGAGWPTRGRPGRGRSA
ncbi:MAG: lipase maturation factor family protein [bacterium]